MLKNVRIVLVGAIYGGNVGAACRAMANMGFSDLALVAPEPLNMEEARRMACAAQNILEARREFATLQDAVADCSVVAGTTARAGLYRAHARPPRELAPRLLEAAQTGPVALVFGRETWGLTNEELAVCTHLIQIPSSPEYPSLNLAAAVLLCCYELFCAAGIYEPPTELSPEAPSAMRERMFAMWERVLLDIGFMEPEKALHMMLGIRRIFARGARTENDVNILMGIARQMAWKASQGGFPVR